MAITCLVVGSAVGNVRIFIDGTNQVITIVFGGLAFVYRIITTPFGYIFKPIGTFFIRGNNANELVNFEGRGGRKRKTRKTDKNKKNKTRKNRRGKKHNTRHRRRRLTIRR